MNDEAEKEEEEENGQAYSNTKFKGSSFKMAELCLFDFVNLRC